MYHQPLEYIKMQLKNDYEAGHSSEIFRAIHYQYNTPFVLCCCVLTEDFENSHLKFPLIKHVIKYASDYSDGPDCEVCCMICA